VVLLSLGATLLALAVFEDRVVARQKSQRTILIVLGLVTGLPGAYASATLFAAFRRWPGYRYDLVPSWDD